MKDLEKELKSLSNKNFFSFYSYFQKVRHDGSVFFSITDEDLTVLHRAFLLDLNFTKGEPVFVNRYSISGLQMFELSDITASDLTRLHNIASTINNPILHSRIYDLFWVLKRDHSKATQAIDSYLTVFDQLLFHRDDNGDALKSLQRSIVLFRELGRNPTTKAKIEKAIVDKINSGSPTSWTYAQLCSKVSLIELIADEKLEPLLPKTQIIAATRQLRKGCNFELARRLTRTLKSVYLRANKTRRAKRCDSWFGGLFKSEFYGLKASSNTNAGAMTFFLRNAISSIKSVGGDKNLLTELQLELKRYQQLFMQTFQSFEAVIPNVQEAQDAGYGALDGKSFQDKIDTFISLSLIRYTSEKDLKANADKRLSESRTLIDSILGVEMDDIGNVISSTSLNGQNDSKELRAIKEAESNEAFRQTFVGATVLEGARLAFLNQHGDPNLFDEIIMGNPFIPYERALFFKKAFGYFLRGDFADAAHLIIPQMENSIRTIISQSGGQVTYFEHQDGTQKEYDLNTLLYKDELCSHLGDKELVFLLRVLLVSSHGHNLRNKLSHGRLSHDYFSYPIGNFLFAMTLLLCKKYQYFLIKGKPTATT